MLAEVCPPAASCISKIFTTPIILSSIGIKWLSTSPKVTVPAVAVAPDDSPVSVSDDVKVEDVLLFWTPVPSLCYLNVITLELAAWTTAVAFEEPPVNISPPSKVPTTFETVIVEPVILCLK